MDEQHLGHRKRLRDRYISSGLVSFSDHECVELILTYAIPRKDVKPIAKNLLKEFGSLAGIFEASLEDIKSVKGIGDSAAILISIFLSFGRRYRQSKRNPTTVYDSSDKLASLCTMLHYTSVKEKFYLICLDNSHRITSHFELFEGSTSNIEIYIPTIIKKLLVSNAKYCVFTHNHPRGSVMASEADITMTFKAMQALRNVGVNLQDHIIVNDSFEWSSMRDANII